ncbi:MAG: hypothetical protein JNM89_00195 [Hyphomicrobiaceae bacterium]|nr:hypothetical protein [Hyphomicrobiaceae bacterium]
MATAKTYREAYEGWLSGLLAWDDFDSVMATVASSPAGWWVYDTRGEPPEAPEPEATLPQRLAEIGEFLRRHHRASYCGFAYVDDRASPSIVKIYDPRNASSCSLGTPLAVYTLSRMRPERLPFGSPAKEEPAAGKGRLFGRFFKGA